MNATIRRTLVTVGVMTGITAAMAGSAFADNCANVSRPAPACYTSDTGCTTPVIDGRWAFLPSLEGPDAPPIWVFGSPENFTNGQSSGLTQLANTKSGGAVCATPNRQFSPDLSGMHGVLSGEACGIGG